MLKWEYLGICLWLIARKHGGECSWLCLVGPANPEVLGPQSQPQWHVVLVSYLPQLTCHCFSVCTSLHICSLGFTGLGSAFSLANPVFLHGIISSGAQVLFPLIAGSQQSAGFRVSGQLLWDKAIHPPCADNEIWAHACRIGYTLGSKGSGFVLETVLHLKENLSL